MSGYETIEYVGSCARNGRRVNTKVVAILVTAMAVGAIGFAFSTGALNTGQTSTSSCSTENSTLLAGSFRANPNTPHTYSVEVFNTESQEVTLTSYELGAESFSISVVIPGGQNGTFTTAQDVSSETRIPVRTSCGNQFVTTSAQPVSYTEDIAPTSILIQDSTHVSADLLNHGNGTAALTAYYVTDSRGDEYALTNWNGPSIGPNSDTATTFDVGSSCSQCTLSGSAFSFTSGSQYTIKVVTERGNIFIFTVNHREYSIVLYSGIGSAAR